MFNSFGALPFLYGRGVMLRPFLLPLFTRVRVRGVLGTPPRGRSPKFTKNVSKIAHMEDSPRSDVLDTCLARAARGGGLYPFFLRPAKEG